MKFTLNGSTKLSEDYQFDDLHRLQQDRQTVSKY